MNEKCRMHFFFCSKHLFFLPVSAEHSWCSFDDVLINRLYWCLAHQAANHTFGLIWAHFCWQIGRATVNFGKVKCCNCLFVFWMRCCGIRRCRGTAVEPLQKDSTGDGFEFGSDEADGCLSDLFWCISCLWIWTSLKLTCIKNKYI